MVDGKADAHVCCVRPALTHAERHAADERAGRAARDRRVRAHASRASSSSATAAASATARHRRRLVRRRQLRGAAPALGERATTRRARQLLRRRRPALHGAHQLGADRRLEGAEPDAGSRRRSASTTSTDGADDFDFPLGHIQMLGKTDREMLKEGAPGPPRASRSTTSPATRSTSGSRPRTCPTRTTASPSTAQGASTWPTPTTNYEGHRRLIAKLKGLLDADRLPRRTLIPHQLIRDGRIPLAGVAHQCGTVRFGDDPATSGARRQLQGARPRQPLRRRHELLPVVDRGEPGADRDGERPPSRRPPDRAARRAHGRDAGGDGRMKITTLANGSARASSPDRPGRPP